MMKLGKLPADRTTPRLYLAKYLSPTLPPLPSTAFSWTRGKKDWGMLGNDELGLCVIAGIAHSIQVATLNTWNEKGDLLVTKEETVDYYSKWAGYVPGDPSTDNGAIIVDVLDRWMVDGFGMPGRPLHKLGAFADVDASNLEHVLHAIHLLGPVAVGVQLPIAVQGAAEWTVTPRRFDPRTWPGSWGGHDVTLTGFDQHARMVEFISWGDVMRMSFDFFKAYVDEAHAQLLNGWQYVPGMLDLPTLKADLAQLGKVHG